MLNLKTLSSLNDRCNLYIFSFISIPSFILSNILLLNGSIVKVQLMLPSLVKNKPGDLHLVLIFLFIIKSKSNEGVKIESYWPFIKKDN